MSIRLPIVMIVTVLAAGAGYAWSKLMDRPETAAPVTAGATTDRDAPAPRDARQPDRRASAASPCRARTIKVLPDGVDGAQTLGETVLDASS